VAAVSTELLETIIELQRLSSLKNAVLAGGTNLAIRYDHRESIDIDLFFSGIIGKAGYKEIEDEVKLHFGQRVARLDYPCDESDQFMFFRFWVKKGDLNIKVEILQNANFLDEHELVKGVRLASIRDIGLLKLMTAANRASFKDIYDLDYLTEDTSLTSLMGDLKYKQEAFNGEEHRTIFDLDREISPVEDPLRLLLFEQKAANRGNRPNHSDHRILPQANKKNWMAAQSSYRRKVRRLCNDLGVDFPRIAPVG
jgi:hypothetical protein